MEYIDNENINQLNNTVVTIGNFDGFHIGHAKLINVVNYYRNKYNLKSVVLSFFPHTRKVLFNEDIKYIFSKEEKIYLFEQIGIDIFIEYPFSLEFSKLSPEEFIKNILVDKLNCKVLVVGEEFSFGKNKSGNTKKLKNICNDYNIEVIIVENEIYNNNKISSTNIRKLISDGNFKEVKDLLFKDYFIKGVVRSGNKIGRTIGFPTANLSVSQNKILPINGVYITETYIINEKKLYKSITSVGNNPTIDDNNNINIETFIFNFNRNIYNEEIVVYFYDFLRREEKFNSLEDLKSQIDFDVISAKKILGI